MNNMVYYFLKLHNYFMFCKPIMFYLIDKFVFAYENKTLYVMVYFFKVSMLYNIYFLIYVSVLYFIEFVCIPISIYIGVWKSYCPRYTSDEDHGRCCR